MALPGYDVTKFHGLVREVSFSGFEGEDVNSFLSRFNKIADRWGATLEDKAMALWSTCLKGAAQRWSQLLPPNVMDDFNLLSKELRDHYGQQPIQWEEAYMRCRQDPGESTMAFWRRAEQLRQQLILPPLSPQQQIMWVWVRLHTYLLVGKKPADFMDVTSLLEHCRWQELSQPAHQHRQAPPTVSHPFNPSHGTTPIPVYQLLAQQPTPHGYTETQHTLDIRSYQEEINRAFIEGRGSRSVSRVIMGSDSESEEKEGDLIYQIQQLVRGQRGNTQPNNNRGQGGGQGDGKDKGGYRGGGPGRWCDNCRMTNHNTSNCGRRYWCDNCQMNNHNTNNCRRQQPFQQQQQQFARQPPQPSGPPTTSTSPPTNPTPPSSNHPSVPNPTQQPNSNTKPSNTGQGHLERVTPSPQGRTSAINMIFSTSISPSENLSITATISTDVNDEKDSSIPHQPPTPIFALPSSTENNPLTIHGHVDELPLKEIVVDTGSGITCISLRVFNMLTPSRRATLELPDPTIRIQAANNSQLGVKGVTLLNITLGGQARLRDIRALVLDNLGADCIVGNEHLKFFSHIDLRKEQLIFHDGEEIIPLQLSQRTPRPHVYTISLCKTTKIAPYSELIVHTGNLTMEEAKLLTETHHSNGGDSAYLLEGLQGSELHSNVSVGRLILPFDTLQSGKYVPLLLRNDGDTRVTLYKGALIAGLQAISTSSITHPITTPPKPTSESTTHSTVNTVTTQSPQEEVNPITGTETPNPTTSPSLPTTTTAVSTPNPLASIKLDTTGLHSDELQALQSLLERNVDCFAINPKKPSTTTLTTHSIDTGDHRPIRLPPYRTPHHHEEFIEKEIQDLLLNGLIEKSTSPWSFPVVVVGKKDGSKRLCIDFRKLNAITKMDAWPMPDITDLLDSLKGAVIFSSLDLASGYWQVPMSLLDKIKTAFITRYGLYQWKVMPFGLCTAPGTFVRLMDEVFEDLKWKILALYFDDITVYSKTFADHLIHLQTVFDRLRKAGLQVKASKCSFALKEVSFVGHRISAAGISPDPAKIEAVQNFPPPIDPNAVRSFLGLANFYRRFVPSFSRIVLPLTALLKKDVEFTWTPQCEQAFTELKQRLTSTPILRPADFDLPFRLYTDASGYAVGAILGQRVEGKDYVIQYASRTLNTHERNYGVPQKEALAIVWATRLFRNYLLGPKPFLIITDHAPLTGLRRIKDVNGLIGRWSLTLQEYNYMVEYRAGEKNQVDALSRIRHDVLDPPAHLLEPPTSHPTSASPIPLPSTTLHYVTTRTGQHGEDVVVDTDTEDDSDSDSQAVDEGEEEEGEDTSSNEEEDVKQAVDSDSPMITWTLGDKVLLRKEESSPHRRPYYLVERTTPVHWKLSHSPWAAGLLEAHVEDMRHWTDADDTAYITTDEDADPPSLSTTQLLRLNEQQRLDPDLQPIIAYIEHGQLPTEKTSATHIKRLSQDFTIDAQGSLVTVNPPRGLGPSLDTTHRLVVPASMREELLTAFHDSPLAGHLGYKKTLAKIEARYYWKKMGVDTQKWVRTCDMCLRRKAPRPIPHPIRSILPSEADGYSYPFSELVVDTLGPLTRTKKGNSYIIVFIDRLTRWPEAFPTRRNTALAVAKLIVNDIIPRYGAPRTLLSDQGSNYLSKLCRAVYKVMNINKLQTSAYYPQCNGLVERFNHTLANMLSMFAGERQTDWDVALPWVLFAYRTAMNASTRLSPFFILHGFEARHPTDALFHTTNDYSTPHEFVQLTLRNMQTARNTARTHLTEIDNQLATANEELKDIHTYELGDRVLVYQWHVDKEDKDLSKKLLLRWKGPYTVIRRMSAVNYRVRWAGAKALSKRKRREMTAHIYRMRPYEARQQLSTNAQHLPQQTQQTQPIRTL
jgi:hypothetical protein